MADPGSRREITEALRQPEPRTYAIQRFHWAGGWRIIGKRDA
jgi:hypothetical protein